MKLRSLALSIFAVAAFAGLTGFKATSETNYHTMLAQLNQIAQSNADMVQSFELGMSDSGEKIIGVRIQKTNAKQRPDTDVSPRLVVAAHHGNELMSVDVAMQFIKDLIEEARHPKMGDVSNQTYYVIPTLNISGYNQADRMEANAKGKIIDPNRDYPDPCGSKVNFQLKSTKALADFMVAKKIVAAVTIHGYVGTFTYPWGTYAENTHTADQAKFDALGQSAIKENGYQTGTHADVIYPTAGAFEDWAYSELGAWTMLLELADQPSFVNDSKALLRFFSEVPKVASSNHSFSGKCSQRPLDADIKARP